MRLRKINDHSGNQAYYISIGRKFYVDQGSGCWQVWTVILSYNSLFSTVTLFLCHRKMQFLMSYCSMYIWRFMGVCHSSEAKLGLKKIEEYFTKKCWHHQIILLTSAKLQKCCSKTRFALIFSIIDLTFYHHFLN